MVTAIDANTVSSQELLNSWNESGFLILKGLVDTDTLDTINHLIESVWDNRSVPENPLVADIFIGTRREQRVFLRDAPSEARRQPYKLNDLYLESAEIRGLVLSTELCSILKHILRGAPVIWNTLNFEFGSQQEDHVDTLYMPSRVPNKMVASWIALEDVNDDNGPLRYYPGSHKIPPYVFSNGEITAKTGEMDQFRQYISDELEKRNIEPKRLLANKGDVLIWHSQLVHGGSPINNPAKTRRSLVTHYHRRKDYRFDFSKRMKKCGPGAFYWHRDHQPVAH